MHNAQQHPASIYVLVITVLVASLMLTGCQHSSQAQSAGQVEPSHVHHIHIEYPSYESLDQLRADSDIVILGSVIDILPTRRVVPAGIDITQLPPEKAAGIGWI